MGNRFSKQVVWITGASSGIGAALAKSFIDEGAIVALSARREDRLKDLKEKLGENAYVFPLDVQKKAMVTKVARDIHTSFGRLDVVVANAGYATIGSIEKLSEEMWRNQIETNVFGTVWTVQAAIPYLLETKGRIAIISSVAGKIAFGQGSAYSASKFALMGLANALYLELFGSGISVTNLAPGVVESEIHLVDNLGREKEQSLVRARKTRFKWPAEKAARVMINAIYDRKREAVITGHGKIAAFFVSHLPALTYWGMARAGIRTKRSH